MSLFPRGGKTSWIYQWINCDETTDAYTVGTNKSEPLYQGEAWWAYFHMKMSFICMKMKTDFHLNGFAPGFALKKRLKRIR